ncbi:MAG TPA: hypothetical protein GXZ58_05905 [Bacilli bacterium]|nr:hypothetical protein [Bacilli bacterium]
MSGSIRSPHFQMGQCMKTLDFYFAKSIWLDTEEAGYFSDNYFDLLPGETKVVQFIPRNKEINDSMTIDAKSMADMI